MKHMMHTITSFDLKLQEARERMSASPQNPAANAQEQHYRDRNSIGCGDDGVIVDENGQIISQKQSPMPTFRSQEHF